MRDINPAKLAGYDALAIYANVTEISLEQEAAMLNFVAAGGGLVPIHCASFCFHNSPKYIELVGAQFHHHGTGVFKETIINHEHPVTRGLQPIESWDETYVHAKHNEDRTILSERHDKEGAEPWTWVRNHGKGRVFYTAWGHDQRTWSNAGFHALIANGIHWATANSHTVLKTVEGLASFEYMESPSPLPNYTPNARWGTQGQPITVMQKSLSPEASQKHLVTFPEFEHRLYAADPDVVKPLWLAFDERGRLWIAESVDYPNRLQPEGQGNDRLKIIEDSNGDGKADKFTVFVDKLSVPTSFVFANGGVIVIHSGKTEWFGDTDGDDRADESKVLFHGWGTGDTHATASNLRYGFDNWIWGVVGYSGFNGTVGGKQLRFGQGIFRFKPDGSALEFVRSSNNNTWGLGLTEDNVIIGSTANGNASMYMPIANRFYEVVNGWSASRLESIADSQRFYPITDKVRQVDWHGQYTAGSGSAIYTARHFPSHYWNRAQFVAEPTGHLLGLFFLDRRGADFKAYNARNFAASDDEWTAPIYAEVGPDGALWMVDWYNYIIQHNPTPIGFDTGKGNAYDTPLRDKTHGRIYRITHKSAPLGSGPEGGLSIAETSGKSLVASLSNDNLLWRLHAQRLLVERGRWDVTDDLHALVRDESVDTLGLNPAAIHALWSLQGLGLLDGSHPDSTDIAVNALKHPSAAVRKAAVNVLPRNEQGIQALLYAEMLKDSDAQVRLSSLLAISDMPSQAEAGQAVLEMMQDTVNAEDAWIADAATTAAARNDAAFLQAALSGFKPTRNRSQSENRDNLIQNPSFESERDGQPNRWRTSTHSGRGEFSLAHTGRTGGRSVQISSESGGDLSWATRVRVKPRTDYRLSGWIKTENIQKIQGARGAMFNIHELQNPDSAGTPAIDGTRDWQQVEITFNTGNLEQITINCLFGAWGRCTGTAWFDDLELIPAPGSELAGELGRVLRIVTSHYAQRGPIDSIATTLASLETAPSSLATVVLDGLRTGWPEGVTPNVSDNQKSTLKKLMDSLPDSSKDRLLALAIRWGNTEIFGGSTASILGNLTKLIQNQNAQEEQRVASASRLVALNDEPEVIKLILDQVTLLTTPGLAGGLVSSLSVSRHDETGSLMTDAWARFTPTVRRAAVNVLTRRAEWTLSLLEAIQDDSISRTDLATEHWSQLRQHPNRSVARLASRLSNRNTNVSADRADVVKNLLPLAREKGDAERGKTVYAENCATCHLFNGQGGALGPELTGIAARDRSDILLEILDPNRSVEANYRMWTVETTDGEIFSGRLEAETQTTVEILDVAAQKHVIQRKNIESLQASSNSIMPIGFEALPTDDLKALLEYLAQPHE
jgi:putative membrane-bound dehydrogenase-like protein